MMQWITQLLFRHAAHHLFFRFIFISRHIAVLAVLVCFTHEARHIWVINRRQMRQVEDGSGRGVESVHSTVQCLEGWRHVCEWINNWVIVKALHEYEIMYSLNSPCKPRVKDRVYWSILCSERGSPVSVSFEKLPSWCLSSNKQLINPEVSLSLKLTGLRLGSVESLCISQRRAEWTGTCSVVLFVTVMDYV